MATLTDEEAVGVACGVVISGSHAHTHSHACMHRFVFCAFCKSESTVNIVTDTRVHISERLRACVCMSLQFVVVVFSSF